MSDTQTPLVLASASPRRRELLSMLGLRYTIVTADINEHSTGSPEERVATLATRKAKAVAQKGVNGVILAADTLVFVSGCGDAVAAAQSEQAWEGGLVLGKPTNEAEAFQMLRTLSGRWHTVFTGQCALDTVSGAFHTLVDATRVHFMPLTDAEIHAYIRSGEPMDKAGAYGIQGIGGAYIDALEGEYFTVMGLSLTQTRLLLQERGLWILPTS